MPDINSLHPMRILSALRLSAYVRREFVRVGAKPPRVTLRYSDDGHPPQDVRIERRGDEFTFVIARENVRDYARFIRNKVAAFAYWLSLCPPHVTHMTVNVSDGHVVSDARFAASTRFPQIIALPDPHYFQHNGFAADLERGKHAPAWDMRTSDIVWRGEMNGTGWLSLSVQDAMNPAVLQRIRIVMLLKGVDGADACFVKLPRADASFTRWAVAQGFLGAPVPAQSWLNRKYAIDIDGYTNTWSNLLVRLLYGCCVIKVESQFGFRQWYYDELQPYVHYVPVAADMSDLAEKIEWVRAHDAQARSIAEQGQLLARTLTFETQAKRAAQIIEAHWQG